MTVTTGNKNTSVWKSLRRLESNAAHGSDNNELKFLSRPIRFKNVQVSHQLSGSVLVLVSGDDLSEYLGDVLANFEKAGKYLVTFGAHGISIQKDGV